MTLVRPHDLLRVSTARAAEAVVVIDPRHAWVGAALRRAPWVVVRRRAIRDGLVPVGIRGLARSERAAALVALQDVVEHVSPEALAGRPHSDEPFAALSRIASLLEGRPWGPGGSVGFELATGVGVVSPTSDLDIIVRAAERVDPYEAAALLGRLGEQAAPVRIDVVLETPRGGIALADLATSPGRVLVKTNGGPQIYSDPWATP